MSVKTRSLPAELRRLKCVLESRITNFKSYVNISIRFFRAIVDCFRHCSFEKLRSSAFFWSYGASFCLPFHDPKIQDGDAVKDGHKQKGNESGNRQSADLRVTKRLPQGTAVARQRKQRQDGRGHSNQNRAESFNSGIPNRLLEWFAFLMHFLNEIEKHDHVADDDANQARNS